MEWRRRSREICGSILPPYNNHRGHPKAHGNRRYARRLKRPAETTTRGVVFRCGVKVLELAPRVEDEDAVYPHCSMRRPRSVYKRSL
jgi:hypothetical protein